MQDKVSGKKRSWIIVGVCSCDSRFGTWEEKLEKAEPSMNSPENIGRRQQESRNEQEERHNVC